MSVSGPGLSSGAPTGPGPPRACKKGVLDGPGQAGKEHELAGPDQTGLGKVVPFTTVVCTMTLSMTFHLFWSIARMAFLRQATIRASSLGGRLPKIAMIGLSRVEWVI